MPSKKYKVIVVAGVRMLEHRHVMEKYLGRTLERNEIVHHVDGDTLNNNIKNLELFTPTCHAHCHLPKTSKILDREKVLKIKSMLAEGKTGKVIAKELGVRLVSVSEVKHGHTWSHIGNPEGVRDEDYQKPQEYVKGSQIGTSKLKDGEVWLMKKLLAAEINTTLIAKMFCVSKITVRQIKHEKRWKHIPFPEGYVPTADSEGENHPRAKLTNADVVAIKDMLRRGVSQYKIRKQYGVAKNTITSIVKGKTWHHIQ